MKADKGLRFTSRTEKNAICLLAFGICFLLAAAVVVPLMIRNHGYFTLSNDFSAQEIPFGILMNRSIREKELWTWGIDLGGNLLESFSYYDIGSVFFWLTMLFPPEWYPKLIGWVFILKFAVAGATSALWLKRQLDTKYGVLIASILYAFSGAHCINTVFYHFQDVIALFPLLLIGLEKLLEEKKHGVFALTCAVNVLCNPIFFFSSVCYLILYFVVCYAIPSKNLRSITKMILECLIEGFAGCLCGAVILIPEVISMLGNPRATDILPVAKWFFGEASSYWSRASAFLLPPDSMNSYSAVFHGNWTSWSAYLPLFGSLFAIAYMVTERDSLSWMLRSCFAIALIPILGSVFLALSPDQYGRWLFMFDLLFACATGKVCENTETYRKNVDRCSWFLLFCLFLSILFVRYKIYRIGKFFLLIGIAAAGILLCIAVTRKVQAQKRKMRYFLLLGMAFSVLTLALPIRDYFGKYPDNTKIDFYSLAGNYAENAVDYLTEIPAQLEQTPGAYRYQFDEGIGYSYYNVASANDLPGTSAFTSTPHNSVTEFYDSLGIGRKIFSEDGPKGTQELLGAKYVLSQERDERLLLIETLTNRSGQTFYLQENPNAIPIGGLLYDSYMTREEFEAVPKSKKSLVMCHTMVVKPEDEEAVNGTLLHKAYDDKCNYALETCTLAEELTFSKGRNAFAVTAAFDRDGYALYSVPYDRYWECRVNGTPIEVLNVNGLMAVPVGCGENHVEFLYDYAPLRLAAYCTAVGVLLCAGLLIWNYRRRKSGGATGVLV